MNGTTGPRRGIYVASRTRHADLWRRVRAAGAPIISTWIDHAGPGQSPPGLWERCVAEVAGAAALVLFAGPGEALRGAWVEAGVALASGVPVFVSGLPDSVFVRDGSRHRLVTVCHSLGDAVILAMREDGSLPC
jgi:hypothetical protein